VDLHDEERMQRWGRYPSMMVVDAPEKVVMVCCSGDMPQSSMRGVLEADSSDAGMLHTASSWSQQPKVNSASELSGVRCGGSPVILLGVRM
jgi:hypothetical protein